MKECARGCPNDEVAEARLLLGVAFFRDRFGGRETVAERGEAPSRPVALT